MEDIHYLHPKIAILISGQARFLKGKGYQSIKEKILDKYKCDVFCHVWWDPNGGKYITAPWSGLGVMNIPDNVDSDIMELYSPKKFIWDHPMDTKLSKSYTRTCSPLSLYNLPSMYLSMKKSYELMEEYIKETGAVYDWIIRLRYDAILTAFPDLHTLPKGKIYAPDYSQYHNMIGNNGLIMDPEYASIIMKIYDKMDTVYATGSTFNDENMITALVGMTKTPAVTLNKNIFYIELCRN